MAKTKVFQESFKGNDCLAIWPVDENDNKVGNYPIISMGLKKIKLVLMHLNELNSFVKEREEQ